MLVHIQRLRARKTLDLAVQVLVDETQNIYNLEQGDLEKLQPRTSDLQDSNPLLLKLKKLQVAMGKNVDYHFGSKREEKAAYESQFSFMLKLIYISATRRHRQAYGGNSTEELGHQNLLAIGEQLACLSQELKTDLSEVDEQLFDHVINNTSILSFIIEFKIAFRSLEGFLVAYVHK